MTLKRVLLAATILATPVAASAQPVTGLYIGAGAGANWISNPEKWDISGSAAPGNFGLANNTTVNNAGKANFHTGWAGVGSLGWGFGNGFRAEIEGNYRANEVDSIRGNLAPVGRTGGFQYTYGAMANVLYDFDFANFGMGQSTFQPYVGVGVGYAWTEWRNIRGQSNRAGAGGAVIYADDTDAQFAYQGILGVGTPLTWLGVTGLTLTAEYRFFGTLQPKTSTPRPQPSHQCGRGRRQGRARTTTTTRSCSACATRCSSRRRRRRRLPSRPRPWHRPRRAPTWSSSTGIAPT